MSRKLIAGRLQDLHAAADYASWREIALELDRLEGADAWKQDETSEEYDYLLIKERLQLMRSLRRSGSVRQLSFHLAESLHGNLGNTSNPLLYSFARVGTKQLIHEYVEEVVRCLDYICVGDFPDFGDDEKFVFFRRTGMSFGRSALLLSGGATLGMFHLGVIKALLEHNLLPRVISGSSAGSLVAGMVGTRTDEELHTMFEPGSLNLQAFQTVSLNRLLRGSTLMDPTQLEICLGANIGAGSFLENFERTRRIIGVTVSPAEMNQQPRLLNYLTAPHVIVRKGVQASCAVPGVFPPVLLEAEDYSGQVVPYMRSKRWVDGSLANDLPMLRLARLHNVNHFIVSQTNPHVVPFMQEHHRRNRGLFSFIREVALVASRDLLKVTREHLHGYGPRRMADALNDIIQQRYSGDVNIFPSHTPRQLMRMFSNLTADELQCYIREGERRTWPRLERIRVTTRISRTLDDCLELLKVTQREKLQAQRRRPRAVPKVHPGLQRQHGVTQSVG
jgi:predicted acylesterase/phospholipase RssA